MSIFEYIEKYGNYGFEEKDFTEVDNVILSALSYLDLEGIVSSNVKNKKMLGEVFSTYFKLFSVQDKNIMAVRNAIDIFKSIGKKKRYRDILMYCYAYVGDEEQQFSAVVMDITSDVSYISFEGTDHLISGWKEDFKMSYQFPVLSQRRAIHYVNRNFIWGKRKLILGGHSKGGNLAMVASMYCHYLVRRKILWVYNNDGPGLRMDQLQSKNYQMISSKLIHIIPDYSIVGLLLQHTDNFQVIQSTKKSILAHAVVTWVVEGDSFKRAKQSKISKIMDEGLARWLEQYDDRQKEKFVTSLFDIFSEAGVSNLIEIMDNKAVILKLIQQSVHIDVETRKMILEFVSILFRYFKDSI